MNQEIIKEIKNSLNNLSFENDKPYFSDKRYKPFEITKNNFHKIKLQESDKKIAFIDGGNSELLKSANFSLQLIRLYYVIYHKNKRINSKRTEFFVFVNTVKKENKIFYTANLFDNPLKIDENDFVFELYDETLSEGKHKVDISKIAETVRRFSEIKLAEIAAEKADIIIRDGSLQSSVTNEKKYFESLYEKALEKNVVICGFCKTNSLVTEKGCSLALLLAKLSPGGSWYYYPLADITHPDHKAHLYFIKLHANSRHIFRFEVFKENNYEINEILSLLKNNSRDPVFLGYPYGLIEADKFARVSNQEKEYYKTIINSKIGFEDKDAHNILDSIG